MMTKFGLHLFSLAIKNFGHPIHTFLTRFTAELARDRKGFAAVVTRHVATYKASTEGIASPARPERARQLRVKANVRAKAARYVGPLRANAEKQ